MVSERSIVKIYILGIITFGIYFLPYFGFCCSGSFRLSLPQ